MFEIYGPLDHVCTNNCKCISITIYDRLYHIDIVCSSTYITSYSVICLYLYEFALECLYVEIFSRGRSEKFMLYYRDGYKQCITIVLNIFSLASNTDYIFFGVGSVREWYSHMLRWYSTMQRSFWKQLIYAYCSMPVIISKFYPFLKHPCFPNFEKTKKAPNLYTSFMYVCTVVNYA